MRARRRLTRIAACAFAVAALGYSAWAPAQFLNSGIGRSGAYISELAAADQPWSWLVRGADVAAGIACLVAVALVPDERPGRWGAAGWLGLALLGGMTVLDSGLFPLDCAAVSDLSCAAAEAAGRVSPAHRIHTVTSALAATGAVLSLVALPVSALRRRRWPLIGYGGAALAALAAAATVWTLAAIALAAPVGTAQRLQVAVIGLWLLLLGVALWRDRTAPAPPKSHVLLEGAGAPVLICAGMAGAWFHWDRVAADLRRDHTVIRFDRPGLGFSSGHRGPPTLREEAERIGALARFPVVVGHSVAGWHAEAFARLHPGRVAGLVLVDPSCVSAPRPRGAPRAAVAHALQRILPALGGTFGATALTRLALPLAHRLVMGPHERARSVYGRGPVLAAAAAEWLAYPDMAVELDELRRTHPFPDVPAVILSAGPQDRCHHDLAGLLNAELVSLPGSGHEVQLDRPEAITEAVRKLGRFHNT
ncbi:alpha/beta fold hydrolase [Streptosporangium sp. CA-135522]|uniref:alpha/beta fold hydrolase n=1 Tax=Streptosporangium sp. CA-135522 TaxID=3240072 RepID=UPI003D915BDD